MTSSVGMGTFFGQKGVMYSQGWLGVILENTLDLEAAERAENICYVSQGSIAFAKTISKRCHDVCVMLLKT